MPRSPFLIASSVVGGTLCWSIRLAVDGGPLAPSSAAAVATGLLIYSVVAVTGMLLVRGRWARRLAVAVAVAGMVVGAVVGVDGWGIPALVLSVGSLVGLAGPWLDGWLRRLPAADGPGPKPLALALGGLVLVPAVGVASPAGLEPLHGVLAATGLLLTWAYARAHLWALWGLRITLVPLAVATAAAGPLPGTVLLVSLAVALTALAWTREARIAVDPLMARLPGPRHADTMSAARDRVDE